MVQVNVPLAKHIHWRSHRLLRIDAQVVGQTGLTTVGVGIDEVIDAGGCEGQESAGGEICIVLLQFRLVKFRFVS
jgi:hypothetical protein